MNAAAKLNEIGSSAEGALLVALTEAGFPVSSVAALRDQFDMLPCPLAALLLAWIPRLADRRLQESVMWALLSAPTGSLDGVALTELFDATEHDELKWAIAAVINQTRPQHVDEWLMTAVCDPRSGAARNHLASAIAKMVSPEQARPVLLELFCDAPLAAVHPLSKVGNH